jgi:uncharacterized membrane protein
MDVTMREWLDAVSDPVIVMLDALALLVIVIATLEVAVKVVRAVWHPLGEEAARRAWLRYARSLVAALTFQLAADIIETSITTSWQTVGRVAAVALVRTFLNYFLEKDVDQQRALRAASATAPPP